MTIKNDIKSCNIMMDVACQCISEGYGNAVVGRYGGCFQEDNWLTCRRTRESLSTELYVLAKYASILDVRKGNAQHRRG